MVGDSACHACMHGRTGQSWCIMGATFLSSRKADSVSCGTQERLDTFRASGISSALWEGWDVVLGGRLRFSVHCGESEGETLMYWRADG